MSVWGFTQNCTKDDRDLQRFKQKEARQASYESRNKEPVVPLLQAPLRLLLLLLLELLKQALPQATTLATLAQPTNVLSNQTTGTDGANLLEDKSAAGTATGLTAELARVLLLEVDISVRLTAHQLYRGEPHDYINHYITHIM
jgi:hypothetical protein